MTLPTWEGPGASSLQASALPPKVWRSTLSYGAARANGMRATKSFKVGRSALTTKLVRLVFLPRPNLSVSKEFTIYLEDFA